MNKKIIGFILICSVAGGVVKILFFSGITQPEPLPFYRPAQEPGFVWASAGQQYARSQFGEWWLGQHYRAVWTTPIKVPVFKTGLFNGGMHIGKLGGGQQTTSLSLTASDGQTWVLRSLDKDPVNILPPIWRRSVFANLLRDQISAGHPYAPLVVSRLAAAAGIYHTNPRVVFVSATGSGIGSYKERLGNKLFLLEEKYGDSAAVWPQFKGATAMWNSREMLQNRYRYQHHRIDQAAFAYCRLFDLLIGDWDRHEDQWTWVAFAANSGVIYKPIPKDRDQAFSLYQDGVLPWVLTRDFALPKFGHFDYQVPDITGYTQNAAFIDERALTAVTQADFLALARQLQISLTDSVIRAAVKELPLPIYQLSGPDLVGKLKSRRQALPQIALAYYQVLARHVVVPGTDNREKFEVNRLPDGNVWVKVYALTPTLKKDRLLYQRLFRPTETTIITLHGLDGNDIFVITGKAKQSIKIKIVGGLGEDKIADYGVVTSNEKNTVIFDTRTGNDITWGPNTEDQTTDDFSVHLYDREGL